ncbi:MAG: DUF1801 domain-containing protein [Bryobacterales bacterium]|nr:DUF1801 domain-containing protein [Bryobacterales bacterium]
MKKKPGPGTVDAYLAAQSEPVASRLAQVRAAIRAAAPDATETIAYGMPAYQLPGGGWLIYFAAWKKHYSLYPVTAALLEELGVETGQYAVEKGTVRFSYDPPVPVPLVKRIVKARAKQVRAKLQ